MAAARATKVGVRSRFRAQWAERLSDGWGTLREEARNALGEIPTALINLLITLALVSAISWAWDVTPALGVGVAVLAFALWLNALRQLFTGARGRLWTVFAAVDLLIVPSAAFILLAYPPFG